MEALGGINGSADCSDDGPPWSGRQRDRRKRKERPAIDLTECPKRNRPLVGDWVLAHSNHDTEFVRLIVDTLLPFLRRRRIETKQGEIARQALMHADAINVYRHARIGYLFAWSSTDAVYYIAIREEDTLTARLDELQWQFGKTPQERNRLNRSRQAAIPDSEAAQHIDKVLERTA